MLNEVLSNYGLSYVHWLKQTQLPDVFYKKSYSQKYRNIDRKKPMLKPLFDKVSDLSV